LQLRGGDDPQKDWFWAVVMTLGPVSAPAQWCAAFVEVGPHFYVG
jgi:hypothetical protein